MKLFKLLEDKNISPSDFAEQVKCSLSMISHINSGRRRPSPELAWRIERALDGAINHDQLLCPWLYEHLENLESQIKPEFDQALSRRIDKTTLIIEG